MRRRVSGLLVASMLLLAGCGGLSSGSSDPTVVKIGLIAPLTGDVKTFGESAKKGFDLALEQVNKKAGSFTIEAVYGDDRNDATEGRNIATKMMTKQGVSAIVGSVTSKVTKPVSEEANLRKVPMISGTATAAGVTVTDDGKRRPYSFRACFIDPFQGEVAAKFALNELKVKTAAVFYDKGNPYTVGLTDSFKASFEQGGGTIIALESYAEVDTDFSAVMTKVAGLKPDMLYLPDYYPKASLLAKAAKDKGITVPMLGGDGWDSSDLDYSLLDGHYFTAHYSADDPSPEVQKFVEAFQAKYGEKPDSFAALVYDATNIVLEGIRQSNSKDPDKIRQAMQDVKDFKAVGGSITFDQNGNPIKAATILQVSKEGVYKYVATVDP